MLSERIVTVLLNTSTSQSYKTTAAEHGIYLQPLQPQCLPRNIILKRLVELKKHLAIVTLR